MVSAPSARLETAPAHRIWKFTRNALRGTKKHLGSGASFVLASQSDPKRRPSSTHQRRPTSTHPRHCSEACCARARRPTETRMRSTYSRLHEKTLRSRGRFLKAAEWASAFDTAIHPRHLSRVIQGCKRPVGPLQGPANAAVPRALRYSEVGPDLRRQSTLRVILSAEDGAVAQPTTERIAEVS